MNGEIIIVCAGAIVLLLILFGILLLLRNRPFKYKKKVTENKTTLRILANKNLNKVTVQAKFAGDSITFERKRIRKGQTVEFTYPKSNKSAKVIIEVKGKKPKAYEV